MYSTPLIAVAFFISFEKKLGKSLALSQKLHTFANAITKVMHFGSLAQLNRASDYGSEGWGFESLRARQSQISTVLARRRFPVFLIFSLSAPETTAQPVVELARRRLKHLSKA